MASESWTVRRLLQWSAGWLAQRGVDSARLDGELLLAEALQVRRLDLFLDPDRPLREDELARFRVLIRRRGQRESVAHILGRKGFWKQEWMVHPTLLAPRPETELVVETALKRIPVPASGLRLLEVGVGTGALLLSLLSEWPTATGVGVDVRQQAVSCTRENALKQGLAGRCLLVQGDVLTWAAPRPLFDLVVANPPYVTHAEAATLPPEVRNWEDPVAWDGGADGLDFYRRLVPMVWPRLVAGGWLVMEIGASQGAAVRELVLVQGFDEVQVLQDFARHDRVVAGQKSTGESTE